MKKILIAGCGGAPSQGVVRSLLRCEKNDEVIGMGSQPTDLFLSRAKRKYVVPRDRQGVRGVAAERLAHAAGIVHFQNDLEIFEASKLRSAITQAGPKLYMPTHAVIDTCVHKYKSYVKWKAAGIKVPENKLLANEGELKAAFDALGNKEGKIWLRASSIGGGGKGALPTNDFEFAKRWIDRFKGWGDFVAARTLTPDTVTWLSILVRGESSSRRRASGRGGRTATNALRSHRRYEGRPDFLRSNRGQGGGRFHPRGRSLVHTASTASTWRTMSKAFRTLPRSNISRFFTTVLFFTVAGLNLPKIFKDIVLHGEFPSLERKMNPLPNGLLWLRGMDTEPALASERDLQAQLIQF